MYVELHILQNFAPSNLNRDDTNSPKECEFGGYRRARISSQCLKRAIRSYFEADELLPAESRSVRTKRIVDELARQLTAAGKQDAEARGIVEAALSGLKLKLDEKTGKTQYLLFLGQREIDRVKQVCLDNWDALAAVAPGQADSKSARDSKKAKRESVPDSVVKAMERSLDGGKAASVALFGRMLADIPEHSRDAAAQVAHAISTHRVGTEFDFYTAVDDLRPEDTAGADMLGTVEFNSACFYRYSNVNLHELSKNLQGDEDLARAVLAAFTRASIHAVPTGKQNSMAAHNPPSLILAVSREGNLQNLANAFVQPVRADWSGDLIANSVKSLRTGREKLERMYGSNGVLGAWVCTAEDGGADGLGAAEVGSAEELVEAVLDSARFGQRGAQG